MGLDYPERLIRGLLGDAKGFRLPGRPGKTSGRRVDRFSAEKGNARWFFLSD